MPEESVGDPDTTFVTVPNVPLLTGLEKVRNSGWSKNTAVRGRQCISYQHIKVFD